MLRALPKVCYWEMRRTLTECNATSQFDPNVWSGRALQEVLSSWRQRSCIKAFASLGLTDLPPTPMMIIGIVVLLLSVVAYENWRLTRMIHRCGYHGVRLSGPYARHRPWQELSPWMRALRVGILICWAVMMIY